MNNKIACCNYPNTVLFIDDKASYLKNLVGALNRNIAFKTYIYPKKALQEIKKYSSPLALHSAKITNVTNAYAEEHIAEQSHIVVDIDASNIYKTIYYESRFENISVAVVDYAMPIMNGLEFARRAKKIGSKFIKILMLTGEADESLAVTAFNEGIIDKFIKKNSPSYLKNLNKSIAELQNNYFYDSSHTLISTLSTNQDCCLDDDVFIKFFKELCKEKKICEYYLADEMGSFLLVNQKGDTFWLIVNSKNMLDNYSSVAADSNAIKSIAQSLKNKQKVLFLFTQQNLYLSVEQWDKYMHPAQKLVGNKNEYYYAFINGKKVIDFQPNKITSYKNYLIKNLSDEFVD